MCTNTSGGFKLVSAVAGSLMCSWELQEELGPNMEKQRGEGSPCSPEARMGMLQRDTNPGHCAHWKGSPGTGTVITGENAGASCPEHW